MKSKLEIIQRLLSEAKITVEEAVVLLQTEVVKEYIGYPIQLPYYQIPYVQPWTITCGLVGTVK